MWLNFNPLPPGSAPSPTWYIYLRPSLKAAATQPWQRIFDRFLSSKCIDFARLHSMRLRLCRVIFYTHTFRLQNAALRATWKMSVVRKVQVSNGPKSFKFGTLEAGISHTQNLIISRSLSLSLYIYLCTYVPNAICSLWTVFPCLCVKTYWVSQKLPKICTASA